MTVPTELRFLLLLVLCGLLSAPAALAQAATSPETGVWWQLRREGGGIAPPAALVDIPEGGLWLNSGPNGEQAVSALRFDVPRDAVAEGLTLRIHEDNSTPEPVMALCPPAEPWQPPDEPPGPWEQRAVADCERHATNGVVSEDGETVAFSLLGYGAGEDVDLVLTRVPDDSDTYLSVTFAAPVPADLQTREAVSGGGFVAPSNDPVSPTTTTTPPPVAGGSDTSTGSAPSGSAGPRSGSASGGFGGAGPALPPTSAPPTAAPTTPLARDEQSASAGRQEDLAAEDVVTVEQGTSAATAVASVFLIGLAGWIALIVAHRVRAGRGAIRPPSYTLYKGTPPTTPT